MICKAGGGGYLALDVWTALFCSNSDSDSDSPLAGFCVGV